MSFFMSQQFYLLLYIFLVFIIYISNSLTIYSSTHSILMCLQSLLLLLPLLLSLFLFTYDFSLYFISFLFNKFSSYQPHCSIISLLSSIFIDLLSRFLVEKFLDFYLHINLLALLC